MDEDKKACCGRSQEDELMDRLADRVIMMIKENSLNTLQANYMLSYVEAKIKRCTLS